MKSRALALLALAGCIGSKRTSSPPKLAPQNLETTRAPAPPAPRWPGLLAQGDARLSRGDLEGALVLYEEALALRPQSIELRFRRAYTLGKMKRFGDSVGAYHEVLAVAPTHRGAILNLGAQLRAQGKLTEAIKHYEAALSHRAHAPALLNNLAVIELQLGRTEQAKLRIRSLLLRHPGDLHARLNLAAIYQKEGRAQMARKLLQDGLTEAEAKGASALAADYAVNLGLWLAKQAQPAAAAAAFERALERSEKHVLAHYNSGVLALRFRNYEKARDRLKVAVAAWPQRYEVLASLAFAHQGMEEHRASAELLERARAQYLSRPRAEDAPFALELVRNLAIELGAVGELQKAISYAEQYIQKKKLRCAEDDVEGFCGRYNALRAMRDLEDQPAPLTLRKKQEIREASLFKELNVLAAPAPTIHTVHPGYGPTYETAEEAISSFSVDADTASFSLAQSMLAQGRLPPEAAVRVEAFINAFRYDYRRPSKERLSVSTEIFPSPHRKSFTLHIGLQAGTNQARAPLDLVLVLGASQAEPEALRRSLKLLLTKLLPTDRVAVVRAGLSAELLLGLTPATAKAEILTALDRRIRSPKTALLPAVEQALNLLNAHQGAILLATDARAPDTLARALQRAKAQGVSVSVVGIRGSHHDQAGLERLARLGGGRYVFFDPSQRANRTLYKDLWASLMPAVKDVKVQVAFDSAVVSRYRLLGYENRKLNRRDFNDDRVDAGEIGAGHQVTAIYELELKDDAALGSLGTLRVHHKSLRGEPELIVRPLLKENLVSRWSQASAKARLSLILALFAEKLRRAPAVEDLSYPALIALYDQSESQPKTSGLRALIELASTLDVQHLSSKESP